ncbi:hypothetical protein [Herbaspirillum sp. NPDC087042]|uniref:hypothetical protein n=1 Tax=Herbaspirillum sp. NPDC087042 TaxID=3364004 RepID=UPI003805F403
MNIEALTPEQIHEMMEQLGKRQKELDEQTLPALLAQVRRLIKSGRIDRKSFADPDAPKKPRLPVKYYDEVSGQYWSGKGIKQEPFKGKKKAELTAYLIPDELADKVCMVSAFIRWA